MAKKDVWNVPPVIGDKLAKRLATPVAPLKKQKKTLTAREWTFVKELVSGDGAVTLKEAAIRAGFNPKSASGIATRLTSPDHCPHIVAAIQEYRAELAAKYNTTYERHMRDLLTIRDAALAAGAFGAAVQAEYRRGQALGTIYVDRKEIRVGTIDSMSKEQVMEKLEEIKKLYGGPPPKDILEMEVTEVIEAKQDPEPEPQTLQEALRNVEKARRIAAQEAKRKLTKQSHYEDRESGELGNAGLPSGPDGGGGVCDGGAEGSEEGAQDSPEPPPSSVSP